MAIKKSTLNLTFWLGMSLGSATAIIFMATCLVYVLIHQDLSFLGISIHRINSTLGIGVILDQIIYEYSLTKDETSVVNVAILFLIFCMTWLFFKSINIFVIQIREKRFLKTHSKKIKNTQTHKHKEEVTLFV